MADANFDIAMLFVLDGNAPVWAESTLNVSDGDTLMRGFDPITSYDDYSNFFDITSFDLAMSVKPDEGAVGSGAPSGGHPGAGAGKPAAGKPAVDAKGGGAAELFDRWRSATEAEADKMRFPLSFDSFSFTRVIDGASPILFQACANQTSFKQAALVKRVSTGQIEGPLRQSLAFLRFDFFDLQLKSVEWEDGDLVTETCSFTCKRMTFQYRQQQAAGNLLPVNGQAEWDRAKDSKASGDG